MPDYFLHLRSARTVWGIERECLRICLPLKLEKFNLNVVAYDEATYDWSVNCRNRNRVAVAASKTFAARITTEVYYLRQDNRKGSDANFVVISVVLRDSSLSKLFSIS